MFQERNQRSRNRSDLVWSNFHKRNLVWCSDREISFHTGFNLVYCNFAICFQRGVGLSNCFSVFLLSTQIYQTVFRQINFTVFNLSIWSFNETKIVNLCKYAQRRNQTDVWTFWRFNRTKTTIVSIVHVTNLETGSFS